MKEIVVLRNVLALGEDLSLVIGVAGLVLFALALLSLAAAGRLLALAAEGR